LAKAGNKPAVPASHMWVCPSRC